MKHTEHEYVDAGYRMERGNLSMSTVRHMLESERIDDREEARRLIERGRQEAREQPIVKRLRPDDTEGGEP